MSWFAMLPSMWLILEKVMLRRSRRMDSVFVSCTFIGMSFFRLAFPQTLFFLLSLFWLSNLAVFDLFLAIFADPAIEFFVIPATERIGERLICKLDGFYPEAFDIKWERHSLKDSHFQVITEGVITGPTVRNDDGTFSVTSSLALKPAPGDHGIIYYCVVSHRSLLVPKKLNVILPKKGSVEIYVTIVSPCVLLVLVLILAAVYCLWTWKSFSIWSLRDSVEKGHGAAACPWGTAFTAIVACTPLNTATSAIVNDSLQLLQVLVPSTDVSHSIV
ncbi:h-2 class II histocompatibility antigen, I-A beta chain-like protein [Cricetulus griseus]|nr:h-2 class II histocompatibility antigen, I-A beta chain-like protein [Cricetulus griseus]